MAVLHHPDDQAAHNRDATVALLPDTVVFLELTLH